MESTPPGNEIIPDKLNKKMNKNITYNPGTTFKVCTHEELVNKGWVLQKHRAPKTKTYEHVDFKKGGVITYSMIDDHQGQTLTIIGASINFLYWYYVKENNHLWPVATFFDDISTGLVPGSFEGCPGKCVEGQTAILGYIICKICGHNLRKIK